MKRTLVAAILLASMFLNGCALHCAWGCRMHERNASSLVDFLYPDGAPPPQNAIPELRLPLKVGLAFLPPHEGGAIALDAAQKQTLLERIRQRFLSRDFVAGITIIPDYYLASRKGPESLESVQRLYSVDVIALISYDQVGHRDDNRWSLGYLTIVGAYLLKGTSQDVSTLVDLAVVDPATRSLVLRAGGVDTRHTNSTLVTEGQESRALRVAGFGAATDQMIGNFDVALRQFESDVRAGKAAVRVVRANGGGGGAGAFDWALIAASCAVAALRYRRRAVTSAAVG